MVSDWTVTISTWLRSAGRLFQPTIRYRDVHCPGDAALHSQSSDDRGAASRPTDATGDDVPTVEARTGHLPPRRRDHRHANGHRHHVHYHSDSGPHHPGTCTTLSDNRPDA